jgi:baseplate J-like protein
MSCDHTNTCSCGCCEGVEITTPLLIDNEAGLQEVVFRIGTHGSFKKSMLAGISGSVTLKDFTSRKDDDPGIALTDAWATVLDVLTFYQARIIQEGYIRTANERLSLVELSRHISYRPKPGVAAGVWLSFFLDESPGAPTEAIIENKTKVQSIPGQDETAQVFETIESIDAKTRWNAIRPALTEQQSLSKGCTEMYLEGTSTQLQIGDTILIVGSERFSDPGSERWDLRTITEVIPNQASNNTFISWREGLGHEDPYTYPGSNAKVYAMRQRASLFGYNAPEPRLFTPARRTEIGYDSTTQDWSNFIIVFPANRIIYLDAVYPKILNDSWIALVKPTYAEIFQIESSTADSQKKYGLNSKTSKLKLDSDENLSLFGLRQTLVLGQSEEMKLAEAPILAPLAGKRILFSDSYDDLVPGKKLLITGQPIRHLQVTERSKIIRIGTKEKTVDTPLAFVASDGTSILLETGDILNVIGSPIALSNGKVKWPVEWNSIGGVVDAGPYDLIPYKVVANTGSIKVATSLNQDELVSELIEIDDVGEQYIELTSSLQYGYWRESVRINANVAQATHGESKAEILGSGNGAVAYQRFKLKQKPLTYISSKSISGIESSLSIKVNDIAWYEAPTFYGRGPNDHIYVVRTEEDGTVYVQFGNGVTGSRLPSGADNVIASYRVGIGSDALVKGGQISILLTPQLGVKSVTNALPSGGAEDPEVIEDIRKNMPLTVLNLDRIVSVLDYQYFANAFAGIGKARADLLWKGENRTLHLTVASADEGAVDEVVKTNLINAIDSARHDLFPVVINSFTAITFDVNAAIKIAPDYTAGKVLGLIKEALIENFSFESRDFGQQVTPSDVVSIIHDITGVVAVKLMILGGQDPYTIAHYSLISEVARWSGNTILPAELMLIDPNQITLSIWTDEN